MAQPPSYFDEYFTTDYNTALNTGQRLSGDHTQHVVNDGPRNDAYDDPYDLDEYLSNATVQPPPRQQQQQPLQASVSAQCITPLGQPQQMSQPQQPRPPPLHAYPPPLQMSLGAASTYNHQPPGQQPPMTGGGGSNGSGQGYYANHPLGPTVLPQRQSSSSSSPSAYGSPIMAGPRAAGSPAYVGSPHQHSDTSRTPLPAEAYGARNLIDFLYGSPGNLATFSHISPPDLVMVPKQGEVGLPLVSPSAPVDEATGRRLVYLGRAKPPVAVLAETKMRGVAICFKLFLPPGAAQSSASSTAQATSYGTVLGYSDDDTAIIWHDRAERFASVVSLSRISTIHRAIVVKCRHCGLLQLRSELREHIGTHKKGSGFEFGLFTDDSMFGWMCGDTSLIQCMTSPQKLGEGGQGVVELYNVRSTRVPEERHDQQGSEQFSHPSKHLAPDGSLTKAVIKTMVLPNSCEGTAQYQKSVRFMAVMNHEHLVEYLAVQLLPDLHTLRIAMPFYSEGDLTHAVGGCRAAKYAEETFICTVGLQLSVALAFLHERNPPIVHGDIKLENIMFYNNEQQIVLMDLDASREVRITEQAALTDLGTAEYMAPETMNNARLMTASDMWALGVVLYVLVVNPSDVMIEHMTEGRWLLNGSVWATPEDKRVMNEFLQDTQSNAGTLRWSHKRLKPISTPLGECVRMNIERKRYGDGQRSYSPQLTQLIVDLLSYSPWRRPDATETTDRLTDIMTRNLLSS